MYFKLILFALFILFHDSDGKIYEFNLENKYITVSNYQNVTKVKIARESYDGEIEAIASLTHELNRTGWNTLSVWTNPNLPDEETSISAGQVEGFATAKYIYEHWYNSMKFYCDDKTSICPKIYDFIFDNYRYTLNEINSLKHNSTYWYQVYLYFQQLQGLADGYKLASKSNNLPNISFLDILLMNLEGDLFDLVSKFNATKESDNSNNEGHCSAIIKLLPKNKDLYVAHNSWFKYYAMNRILKKYNFNYRELPDSEKRISGSIITMSSYPGKISSFDDYYLISSGLAVLETSIDNNNKELWKFVLPNTVLESIRVMVANRLAKDGKSWSKIFKLHNSGTYNNQWMVVDYKKFKPGKPPKEGLLWILEQLPGHITAKDQTIFLKKHTYWFSYNIPFYQNIFNLSGNVELVEKYGDIFSYERAPRAKIMKRDHKNIKDLDSLMTFMRYNDYLNDPLSRCNCTPPYSASNAIASRHDLNPINGSFPIHLLSNRPSGAIDAKLTNSSLMKSLQFIAVNGPTTGTNLPVFKWSTSIYASSVPHLGQPDEWNFKPIVTEWDLDFNSYTTLKTDLVVIYI